jgi:hypothetical protein
MAPCVSLAQDSLWHCQAFAEVAQGGLQNWDCERNSIIEGRASNSFYVQVTNFAHESLLQGWNEKFLKFTRSEMGVIFPLIRTYPKPAVQIDCNISLCFFSTYAETPLFSAVNVSMGLYRSAHLKLRNLESEFSHENRFFRPIDTNPSIHSSTFWNSDNSKIVSSRF